MNHETKLARAVTKCDVALALADDARRDRDEAMAAAHDDGWTYERIAERCNMSSDNVRRLVREQRIRQR